MALPVPGADTLPAANREAPGPRTQSLCPSDRPWACAAAHPLIRMGHRLAWQARFDSNVLSKLQLGNSLLYELDDARGWLLPQLRHLSASL